MGLQVCYHYSWLSNGLLYIVYHFDTNLKFHPSWPDANTVSSEFIKYLHTADVVFSQGKDIKTVYERGDISYLLDYAVGRSQDHDTTGMAESDCPELVWAQSNQ